MAKKTKKEQIADCKWGIDYYESLREGPNRNMELKRIKKRLEELENVE